MGKEQEIIGPTDNERPQFPYKIYTGLHEGMQAVVLVNGQPLKGKAPGLAEAGFEWGYIGGGPTNLSYSVLYDYFGGRKRRFEGSFTYGTPSSPWDYYKYPFVSQVVTKLPVHGNWQFDSKNIEQWLDSETNKDNPYNWERWIHYLAERAERRLGGFKTILNGILKAEPMIKGYENASSMQEILADLTRKERLHNLDWVTEVEEFEERVLELTNFLRDQD